MNLLVRRLAAVATATAVAAAAVSCSSDDDDNDDKSTVDTTTAPDADWTAYAGIQVPGGEQGPESSEPVRHGYDHSPQGAVLAAMNTQAQMALADDEKFPEVSTYNLAPSQGRDQWAQGRALAEVQDSVNEDQAPVFKGFHVDDYDDDATQVMLATEYPEVGLMAYPVQLQWISDDWRVVPPPQDEQVRPAPLDNLDDFTEFTAPDYD